MNAGLMLALLAATAGVPGDDALNSRPRRRCPSDCPMCSGDPPVTTRPAFAGDRRTGWTVWRRDGGLDTLIGYVLDNHPDDEDIAGLHEAALRVLAGFLVGACDDGIAEDCEGAALPEISRVHGVSTLPPMPALSTWMWDYEERRPEGLFTPAEPPARPRKSSFQPRWGWQKKHADPVKKAKRKAVEKAKRANRGKR